MSMYEICIALSFFHWYCTGLLSLVIALQCFVHNVLLSVVTRCAACNMLVLAWQVVIDNIYSASFWKQLQLKTATEATALKKNEDGDHASSRTGNVIIRSQLLWNCFKPGIADRYHKVSQKNTFLEITCVTNKQFK